jgi:hypothetical protein
MAENNTGSWRILTDNPALAIALAGALFYGVQIRNDLMSVREDYAAHVARHPAPAEQDIGITMRASDVAQRVGALEDAVQELADSNREVLTAVREIRAILDREK